MEPFTWLQIAFGLVWAYPLVTRLPSGWRAIRGKARHGDRKRTAFWFLALANVGFVVRWFLYPGAVRIMTADELALWGGLYLVSAAACIMIMWANRIEDC